MAGQRHRICDPLPAHEPQGASPPYPSLGAKLAYDRPMTPTGLLGESFNPAHSGHRAISRFAIRRLGLSELWWLVSPGNPLKRSEEHTSDLQSLMRISYAVF